MNYENTEMDEATKNGDENYIEMNENIEKIQTQYVKVRNRGRPRVLPNENIIVYVPGIPLPFSILI